MIKKIISIIVSLCIAVMVALDAFWLFTQKGRTQEDAASNTSSSEMVTSTSSMSRTGKTQYKDGTYTGSTVSTQWGDVQVKVVISSGKISNIIMLKSTSADGQSHSQEVDSQAEPTYINEAKSANSANIQAISGATVTYQGFTTSLQNALTQAV